MALYKGETLYFSTHIILATLRDHVSGRVKRRKVKKKLFVEVPLLQSQVLLQTYTGERMQVLGEIRVQAKYGKQEKPLMLVVIEGSGPTLIGRNWLEQLRLDWKKIGAIAVERNSPQGVDQFVSNTVTFLRKSWILSATSSVPSRLIHKPDQSSAKLILCCTASKNQWERNWRVKEFYRESYTVSGLHLW